MPRRPNDFYPTPEWATEELFKRVSIRGRVVEPCVGAGDMARVIERQQGVTLAWTNDIDTSREATTHYDASDPDFWADNRGCGNWVVTNPPFNKALPIVSGAIENGWRVAALLRLSFLEPTRDRVDFLSDNPPYQIIVLPRISFTRDRRTDSVTCAWMVWGAGGCGISVARRPS